MAKRLLLHQGHVLMFQIWATPEHMGRKDMSISLKPRDYGENKANPRRTYMVGRAWTIWRARRDGWADKRQCRRLAFCCDEKRLGEDILAYQAEAGRPSRGPAVLLGNAGADAALRRWVPALWSHLKGGPHP